VVAGPTDFVTRELALLGAGLVPTRMALAAHPVEVIAKAEVSLRDESVIVRVAEEETDLPGNALEDVVDWVAVQ